ncbi:hypothetical protein MKMG_01876 [Methanogenium sp. MK-MG]|nr:hypothetical protein MKMG_01876 [Methanogenium sp. MK-MG]
MIHPDNPAPVLFSKMKEHVFADNQRKIVSEWLETEEIMFLKLKALFDLIGDPVIAGFILIRQEVFPEDIFGHSLEFVLRITAFSDDFTKGVRWIDIACVYPDIPEDHLTHILSEQQGDGIGLLAHCAPGTPYVDVAPRPERGEHMIDDCLQCLEIPEKECKCHDESRNVGRCLPEKELY